MAVHYQPKAGNAQIFENKVLEALSKAPAVVAYTIYPAVALFFLGINIFAKPLTSDGSISFSAIALTFIGAYFFWSFFEYIMHRWAFHFVSNNKVVQKIVHGAHGIHHEYPKDTNRLIMPPLPWFVTVSLLLGLCYLLMGNYAFSFMAGLLMGYLSYIFVHYQVHLNRPPKFLRKMMVHHALHHYKYDDLAFGVSSTIWDRVFGTMPPRS